MMLRGDFLQHYRIKSMGDIARRLRRRQTKSEALLWQVLRNRRFEGLKFLRQHPIGASVVDFYCHEKRLAIEIDGPVHAKQEIAERDRARQELIEIHGIRFFRCKSEEVESNIEDVLARLIEAVK